MITMASSGCYWTGCLQGTALELRLAHDDQVTGGMVAEVLTLMAAGKCHLGLGQVKVRCNVPRLAYIHLHHPMLLLQ